MSNIERRVSRLEEEAAPPEGQPLVLWADAPIPQDAGDRPIIRVSWLKGEAQEEGRSPAV